MACDVRQQCTRKEKYRSKAKAAKKIRGIVSKGYEKPHREDEKLVPYLCPHCGFWHIGHSLPAHIYFARKKGLPAPRAC